MTYLSASLSSDKETIFGLKKKNLIAALAAFSAFSVSLSGFFAWDAAWKGYRTALLKIEASLNAAQIRKHAAISKGDADGLFAAASTLSQEVGSIVSTETGSYFDAIRKPKPAETPEQ